MHQIGKLEAEPPFLPRRWGTLYFWKNYSVVRALANDNLCYGLAGADTKLAVFATGINLTFVNVISKQGTN